jgi:hypothetical protein
MTVTVTFTEEEQDLLANGIALVDALAEAVTELLDEWKEDPETVWRPNMLDIENILKEMVILDTKFGELEERQTT